MNYHDLLAAAAVRINALGTELYPATSAAQLQIVYSARPLIDEMFGSSIFPMNAIRDALLNAEQKFAQAIAKSADRTLRSYLRGVTATLVNNDDLPSVDVSGTQIIGNYGDVFDAADETVLTRKPVAVIRRMLQTPNLWIGPLYYYALTTERILTPRPTVFMECCVYDAAVQTAAFDADQPMLLPDTLAEALICGGLAMLVRDDEFIPQATQYAQYFATELATIPPATMEAQAV